MPTPVGFTRNTFNSKSGSMNPNDQEWGYTTADATTDIVAANYFNHAAQYISVNQMIRAKCSDKTALFLVTAITNGAVTISEFVPS